jgi:hypothetical protein
METGKVDSGFGYQGNQSGDGRFCASLRPRHTVRPGHKIQGLKYDMGGAIAPGCFQFIAYLTIAGQGQGDDGDDGDDGEDIDFGTTEIEVEFTNAGVFPQASGDARLRPREDRTDFRVEIEDVPEGGYPLRVGGQMVGTIPVTMRQDGSIEGELEFRNPVEPGKILLDFDPRGQAIEVLDGSTVILEMSFPQ